MTNPVLSKNLVDAINFCIDTKISQYNFITFAKITKINDNYTIDAKPLAKSKSTDLLKNTSEYREYPEIHGIPYLYVAQPIVGDNCILLHFDKNVESGDNVVIENGIKYVRGSSESHALNNCIAICGFKNIYENLDKTAEDDEFNYAQKVSIVSDFSAISDEYVKATFIINNPNTSITVKNLKGLTTVEWGDGTREFINDIEGNQSYSHTYTTAGTYNAKFNSVVEVGSEAFYTLPIVAILFSNNISRIEDNACGDCTNLKTVKIGNNIKYIENTAFSGCSNLVYVEISSILPPTLNNLSQTTFGAARYIVVPVESLMDYYTAFSGVSIYESKLTTELLINHPVHSLYLSVDNTIPDDLFGGVWTTVPDDLVLQTVALATAAGQTIAAGLPNIKGSFDYHVYKSSTDGAFYTVNNETQRRSGTSNDTSSQWSKTYFNASMGEVHLDSSNNEIYQNDVYGKSDTVQPPAYTIHAWKRILPSELL